MSLRYGEAIPSPFPVTKVAVNAFQNYAGLPSLCGDLRGSARPLSYDSAPAIHEDANVGRDR
jgi:hypothetical protein